MKKLIAMIALGTTLGLSTGFTDPYYNTNSCKSTSDISVKADFMNDMGGDSKITGTLVNNSHNINYDEVKLKVDFYDNERLIETKTFTVNEDLKPGESEAFELEMSAPKVMDRIAWEVICAETE